MTCPQCEQRPRLPCDRSSTLNRLPQFSHVKMIDILASVWLLASRRRVIAVKRRPRTSCTTVAKIAGSPRVQSSLSW